jgi:hypothetical protein
MLDLNKMVEPILDGREAEKEERRNWYRVKQSSDVTEITRTKLEGRPDSQTVCMGLPQTAHLVMIRIDFLNGHAGTRGAKRVMLRRWLISLAVGVYKYRAIGAHLALHMGFSLYF